MKRLLTLLLALLLALAAPLCALAQESIELWAEDYPIEEDGAYTDMEEVAVYLATYGCLPPNFITKAEARDLGWDSREGNLYLVAPGRTIGGDRFGNYEGLLPHEKGRGWTECDVNDPEGSFRGAERLVFSNDGLIYYTADHYESFSEVVVILALQNAA